MKKLAILVFFLSSNMLSLWAQGCATGETEIIIEVLPDEFTANETFWSIADSEGNILLTGADQTQTLCVNDTACLTFTIADIYGDGIQAPGYCRVYYDAELLYNLTTFGTYLSVQLGQCASGSSCFFPLVADTGIVYTAPQPDIWYQFTPTQTGHYQISTCDVGNACTGSIWVYQYCIGLPWNESPSGTLYFSSTGCNNGAHVNAVFEAGGTYYIRIGDMADNCAGQAINWQMTYNGQVTGCMDPAACNFNPIATLNDAGSCMYSGNPDCPTAPDLAVVHDDIVSSFWVMNTESNDNCAVAEGCVTGYGSRRVITFTMHIQNVGNKDYYIGTPPSQPAQGGTQFEYSPCHGHWHYKGYAAYLLFDQQGHQMPAGFKNGFCVMDIECSGGGIGKFGCGEQGITAGCGDIYSAGTGCQWIDITDVSDGLYTLVALVNWDNSPDATGSYELNMNNNWSQICIEITHVDGVAQAVMVPDCWQFSDCNGNTFGNAQYDCQGICGGPGKVGDIDHNGQIHTDDVWGYVSGILDENIVPTPCNDVNTDGIINITDAALLNACIMQQSGFHTDPTGSVPHSHCEFPAVAITNPNDTVSFSFAYINTEEQYFDLAIYTPLADVLGYDLQITGVQIAGVVNLISESGYAIDLIYNNSGHIIGFSTVESPILRSISPITFLRVYYSNVTDDEICLLSNTAINSYYEETIDQSVGCISLTQLTGISATEPILQVNVAPNPFHTEATLTFSNPRNELYQLWILNTEGKIVSSLQTTMNRFRIGRDQLPSGIYIYRIVGSQSYVGKMVID